MRIGEEFVFIGKDVDDSHFKNFTFGKHYKIIGFSSLPDGDIYGNHQCIMFKDCLYGCLTIYFNKYFVNIDKFRDKTIKSILE